MAKLALIVIISTALMTGVAAAPQDLVAEVVGIGLA